MRKARVILNWQCGRKCLLCCNDYETIMAGRVIISTLDQFANYDEIMLTGGDPLLLSRRNLLAIVKRLRGLNVSRIYLYTTWWNSNAEAVLPFIDGVHFSLHPDARSREIGFLHGVEKAAAKYPDKSFRLFVDATLEMPKIKRILWSRIEKKGFMTEQQLLEKQPGGVPEDESLYVYLPTAKNPNPPSARLLF